MKKDGVPYLNLFLIDKTGIKEYIFKALSSIDNQIKINDEKYVEVTLFIENIYDFDITDFYLFSNIKINLVFYSEDSLGHAINKIIKDSNNAKWITFMDTRDLKFSDGCLLDLFNVDINNSDRNILIFKYTYPVKNDIGQIVSFKTADFINYPFGKFFNLAFLKKNSIFLDESLKQYLFEDFTSKAMEISHKNIWIDLINYYLSPHSVLKKSVYEFMQYRNNFLKFMNKHVNDQQLIIKDTKWSIINAFYLMKKHELLTNEKYVNQLKKIYMLIYKLPNCHDLIKKEFILQNTAGEKDFETFLSIMEKENDN